MCGLGLGLCGRRRRDGRLKCDWSSDVCSCDLFYKEKRGAGLFFVEVGEEGVVLAVVDAAGVQALGEDLGEGAFADAQRAFDDDEAGSLRSSLRGEGALGGGGFVGRHAWMRGIIAKGRSWR